MLNDYLFISAPQLKRGPLGRTYNARDKHVPLDARAKRADTFTSLRLSGLTLP